MNLWSQEILMKKTKITETFFVGANSQIILPKNLKHIRVICIGAGGGGSGSYVATSGPYFQAGGAGGGGGLAEFSSEEVAGFSCKKMQITIGIGGAGTAGRNDDYGSDPGQTGGTSSVTIDGLLYVGATGGAGGYWGSPLQPSGGAAYWIAGQNGFNGCVLITYTYYK